MNKKLVFFGLIIVSIFLVVFCESVDIRFNNTYIESTAIEYSASSTVDDASNAYLKDIKINGESILGFDPKVFVYNISYPYDYENQFTAIAKKLNISVLKSNDKQTVVQTRMNGNTYLGVATFLYTIDISSPDGKTINTYILVLTKERTSKQESLYFWDDNYNEYILDGSILEHTIYLPETVSRFELSGCNAAFDATIDEYPEVYLEPGEPAVMKVTSKGNYSEPVTYTINIVRTQVLNDYSYTGSREAFTAPKKANYILEAWGAQGGYLYQEYDWGRSSYNGGDYVSGKVLLNQGQNIYAFVGQHPVDFNPGWNGGGQGGYGLEGDYANGFGGGGSTDFRMDVGTATLTNRYIVAAGGGGQGGGNIIDYGYYKDGTLGGAGYIGGIRIQDDYHGRGCCGNIGGLPGNNATPFTFGLGGKAGAGTTTLNGDYFSTGGGGGGGGYYGGGGGSASAPREYAEDGHNGEIYKGGNGGSAVTKLDQSVAGAGGGGGSSYIHPSVIDDSGFYPTYIKSIDNNNRMMGGEPTGHQGDGHARISLVLESKLLQSLKFSLGTLSEPFNPEINDYVLTISNDVTSLTIDALARDVNSTVTGSGKIDNIPLTDKTYEIVVTTFSGVENVYTITIKRSLPSYSKLADIKINEKSIPNFNPDVFVYNIDYPYNEEKFSITATKSDAEQTIYGLKNDFYLPCGTTVITIQVLSADKTTWSTYILNITREHTSKLRVLTIKNYKITPEFNSEVYEYFVDIPNYEVNPLILLDKYITYDEEAISTFEGFTNIPIGPSRAKIVINEPNSETTTYIINIKRSSTIARFEYTGDYQTFIAPISDTYLLEAWGAQGGSSSKNFTNSGKGGFARGEIFLNAGEKIYVFVGSHPTDYNSGYNGGGLGGINSAYSQSNGYGGGGATDFRMDTGAATLTNRYLVAGGGGGTGGASASDGSLGNPNPGGNGGDAEKAGATTTYTYGSPEYRGYGGGGATTSTFGLGVGCTTGVPAPGINTSGGGGGGGGGYYGGGGASSGGPSELSGTNGAVHQGGNGADANATLVKSMSLGGGGGGGSSYVNPLLSNTSTTVDKITPDPNGNRGYAGQLGNGVAKVSLIDESNLLQEMRIDKGTLFPSFDPKTNNYTLYLPSTITSIQIDTLTRDYNATVTGAGKITSIPVGNLTREIIVTSKSGAKNTYVVTIVRSASTAKLDSITIDGETIDNFNPNTLVYNINLPYNKDIIDINGIKNYDTQIVDGFTIKTIPTVGTTVHVINVTGMDGTSTKSYVLNITRDHSTKLKKIDTKESAVSPNFNGEILEYTIFIEKSITEIADIENVVEAYDEETTIQFIGFTGLTDNKPSRAKIIVSEPNMVETTYMINIMKYEIMNDYNYTGNYETFTANNWRGNYLLEVWGAQGGKSVANGTGFSGGKGGYARGAVLLEKHASIYAFVGSQPGSATTGNMLNNGYNGGGQGGTGGNQNGTTISPGGGGGGSTDFRMDTGSATLTNRYIVAGGGGGQGGYSNAGAQGGDFEQNGGYSGVKLHIEGTPGTGATVNGPGLGGSKNIGIVEVSSPTDQNIPTSGGGGGGGGYYGGGGGSSSGGVLGDDGLSGTVLSGGAGGNGSINLATLYPGGGGGGGSSYTNSILKGASTFVNSNTKDSNGQTGKFGNEGHGHARVSLVIESNLLQELNVSSGVLTPAFDPNITDYNLIVGNVSSVKIEGLARDAFAEVTGNGTIKTLDVGTITHQITVQAASGIENSFSKNTYTINIVKGDKLSVNLITSDIYDIVRNNLEVEPYIIGMKDKLKISDFIAALNNNPDDIKVYDINGDEITNMNQYTSTGMIVRSIDGDTIIDELRIIVRGDVDGNGLINVNDYQSIKDQILEKNKKTGYYLIAMDVVIDGKINVNDYQRVKDYILGKVTNLN